MSLFAKTSYWIGGSLLAVTPLFSQNESCPPVCQEPPRIECNNAPVTTCCPIGRGCLDLFATASFIYWVPSQENMDLGIVSLTSDPPYVLHGSVVTPDAVYKSGFQVGLGTNLDHGNWDIYSQYTWFRSSQNTNKSIDATEGKVLIPGGLIPLSSSHTFLDGREDWRLHMDLLDLEFGRHYCVKTALSCRPFFGLRAAWIRQNVEMDYLNETTGRNQHNIFITQRSHSWAVGLRTGLSTDWIIGKGFRVYGNGNGDLLFTQYTNLRTHQQGTTTTGVLANSSLYTVRQHDLNCVREHLELELGLGWGTHFCNSRRYIDLSASYGFQIFFSQNMFRNFVDDAALAKNISSNGDLYIHGLTATVRFDF